MKENTWINYCIMPSKVTTRMHVDNNNVKLQSYNYNGRTKRTECEFVLVK